MTRSLYAFLLLPVLFSACSQNNVTEDNSLGKYFDSAGVKGSFGLFDNGQGHFTIYGLPRFRDSAYQPAATFDILLSLIAIQTGVSKDDNALRQAFQAADDSGFVQLAPRIGKDTLKKWIDSLGYGTRYIAGDSFWHDNHLKITADEQLGLLKKLYFNQLPFFPRTQKMVLDMIPSENNANYQLHYKTALGIKEDGHAIAWVMGWVEENKHPYFFVVNLESAGPSVNASAGLSADPSTSALAGSSADLRNQGVQIARSILGRLGFFNGTK